MILRQISLRLAAAALLLTGCAGIAATPSPAPTAMPTATPTASPAPTASPTPSPAPTVADITQFIPAGRYSMEMPTGAEAAPGTWLIEVSPGGIEWTNPENGSRFSPGKILEVTATTLVFGADPGCPDQSSGATSGSYTYTKEGNNFVFALVADSCAGRRDTMILAPWIPEL